MRLSIRQQQQINKLAQQQLGPTTTVALFGSRLEADKHGGDVDLYIETDYRVMPLEKAALKLALEDALGLPFDITYYQRHTKMTPFQSIAQQLAHPLTT